MYKTEQENFWAGTFGEEYINRNNDVKLLSGNINFFKRILREGITDHIQSVIEFGANIGLNLQAIKSLIPSIQCTGVEINEKAIKILEQNMEDIVTYKTSILEFETQEKYDLALIKGVLIHINPEKLSVVYEKLYNATKKYLCIAEYHNITPTIVKYRGFENKLFKRDFAGEIMDQYPDLKLIDYGFAYYRDNNLIQDDINWFLFQK